MPRTVLGLVLPHKRFDKTEFEFSGRGEIYSFTNIYNAPEGFEESIPYTVALVKLEEGPMVTAQLTDLGEEPVEIGMPVEMIIRRVLRCRVIIK